uniref:Integrase zinc-binding domain-containing protein n=1 Tax=Anopheles albimanus TaxID=7167 RepID=A0A182FND7_ANOAL
MQATAHLNEVNEMLTKGRITPTKRMQHLNPVCVNGLIYVQGRLQNAELAEGVRLGCRSLPEVPPVLEGDDPGYPREDLPCWGLLAEFRTRYWMRDLRRTVVGVRARCVPCAKARPHPFAQQMGPLREPRVNASPPFTHTGVDLCGPFVVLPGMRGHRSIDVYVCIFVCFATKAVHLEVVEDQSTQAFISGLMRDALEDPQFQRRVIEGTAEEGIRFAFIPPRSPNFGGLWEANQAWPSDY